MAYGDDFETSELNLARRGEVGMSLEREWRNIFLGGRHGLHKPNCRLCRILLMKSYRALTSN
jgi:hypothetical protein